jgi:hypothetical protein
MMGQRPSMIGNPTQPNSYSGQTVRPGGPGMSPQALGPGKRPGDMRAPNQTGKLYKNIYLLNCVFLVSISIQFFIVSVQ